MKRDLRRLADGEFDLVVVGGGIFGACLAWEGVSRGLSVALVERSDFCHATSANSYKMVHGGIRYLQHGDLYRIRESSHERTALLRVAPHLVRPLPIVVPTSRGLMRGKSAMRIALRLYDLLTADRNRGIKDAINRVPPGRIISRGECLELFPGLDLQDLTGAALFCDAQMYNPTRLALSFLRSAVEAGAEVANYVEATGLLRHGDRVIGITARDHLGDEDLEVRGRVVINAAGPYAPALLDTTSNVRIRPRPIFSRDACFVIPRRLIGDHALAVQGATRDPDAVLSRGARHLFLVPWRHYTLVGVWHVVWKEDPDHVTVTDRDLQGFLEEINSALPGLDLSLDDVSLWNAGLVLFGDSESGDVDLSYGKRSLVIDHAASDSVEGLVTVIGVRYTTARGVAARTVDLAFQKLDRHGRRSDTDQLPVFGGHFDSFDALLAELRLRPGPPVPERLAVPLLRNYGSRYADVLEIADNDPALAAPIGGFTTLAAEVVHAVRREMACKLGDVVFRRTDLGTGEYPGDENIAFCAALMAAELGWTEARVRDEMEQTRSRYPRFQRPLDRTPA